MVYANLRYDFELLAVSVKKFIETNSRDVASLRQEISSKTIEIEKVLKTK